MQQADRRRLSPRATSNGTPLEGLESSKYWIPHSPTPTDHVCLSYAVSHETRTSKFTPIRVSDSGKGTVPRMKNQMHNSMDMRDTWARNRIQSKGVQKLHTSFKSFTPSADVMKFPVLSNRSFVVWAYPNANKSSSKGILQTNTS